jgi:hypothetical protein
MEMAKDARKLVKVDERDPFWASGLRLRSGSPAMLQDELAAYERQLAEKSA